MVLSRKTHADPSLSEPVSGQRIRLGNYGNGSRELGRGILEVYRAGRWGIVCDDHWNLQNAHVACRELGFTLGARHALDTRSYSTGPWSDDSFVFDDVACHGNESSLLECDYTPQHNCHVFEAVSVVCQPNQGCSDSWVAGPNGCYLIQIQPQIRVSSAEETCSKLGGYLTNVDSILENDFLSTTLQTLHPERQYWLIGGRYQGNKWIWKTLRRKKKRDKKRKNKQGKNKKKKEKKQRKHILTRIRRDKNILEEKEMDVTVWFPGWMPSHVKHEPSTTPEQDCLALSRQYALPNGSVEQVSYLFWKAMECFSTEGRLGFICEKPLQDSSDRNSQECYMDNGEEYRGKEHTTIDGLPCQNWTWSMTTNPDTHPNMGLGDHNWCRNPDSDVRPWCWTNVTTDKFAYCAIPLCHINLTSKLRPVVQECPRGQFHCHKSTEGRCISSMFQCDGEVDCAQSEDETRCNYILPKFTKSENVSTTAVIRQTYGTIPVELCAKFCFEEKKFTCNLFSYRKAWKYCYLSSKENQVSSWTSNSDYDIYALGTT
ncbi:uncharacterized protein LOC110448900 isoform X2 [Mizuhopecten yessoensis]|nr:uncharacterized protein LOC110448900 isoform X2 [Mizuhopecten yessoensis]